MKSVRKYRIIERFSSGGNFSRLRTAKIERKYRAIKVVSWRVNFLSGALADFEGLLAVNRKICKRCLAEKAPPDVPPYCAVVPKVTWRVIEIFAGSKRLKFIR